VELLAAAAEEELLYQGWAWVYFTRARKLHKDCNYVWPSLGSVLS
jgi:hypothetical protein